MIERHQCVTMCYNIPGQTWPTELCWLYDTFKDSRAHAEIGTYCGRSLLATCGGMKAGSSVLAVDDDSEAFNGQWVSSVRRQTFDLLIPVPVTEWRMGSLQAAVQAFDSGMRFDSVFIDACHHYAECSADIQAWRSLIKPGGILAGHDYWPAYTGVMDAVNELVPGFQVVPGTRIWFARQNG